MGGDRLLGTSEVVGEAEEAEPESRSDSFSEAGGQQNSVTARAGRPEALHRGGADVSNGRRLEADEAPGLQSSPAGAF